MLIDQTARIRRSAVKIEVQIHLPGLTCESERDQLEAEDQLSLQLQKWKKEIPCLFQELCIISEVAVSIIDKFDVNAAHQIEN